MSTWLTLKYHDFSLLSARSRIERKKNLHAYCRYLQDIHTYITYHIQIYIQSGYLFFYLSLWLLSSLQEHADSVYGCVSDGMVGRLSTLLFEGAIFGRWRSSWTIPRTRRPRTRYDDAATATIGWNRIHPDLPYTILHACLHTYMHTYINACIYDYSWCVANGGGDTHLHTSRTHAYKYVCHLCTRTCSIQ